MSYLETNPYVAGNPVIRSEMFFGRQDVFDFVRDHLIGQHQNNVVILYGHRRSGKTSILYHIGEELGPDFVPIFIDLQSFAIDGIGGYLWELAVSIHKALPSEIKELLQTPDQAPYLIGNRWQFEHFLNQVLTLLDKKRLLLMFDEVALLSQAVKDGKVDPSIFDYLRNLVEHHTTMSFVFSIGSQLESEKLTFGALFTSALYKRISFLDRDSALRLITEPVLGRYTYAPGVPDYILTLTNCHPYFTQLICHTLFALWQHQGMSQITREDVDGILSETLERGLVNFKYIWDEATPMEQRVMVALSTPIKPNEFESLDDLPYALKKQIKEPHVTTSDIDGAVRALINRDILTTRGGVRFAVPLVQRWITDQNLRPSDDLPRNMPIIAIMGSKGGVGKTTIAVRMAELVAEAGHNVLILDFDIGDAGTTILHRGRLKRNAAPTIRTVFDHVLPYSKLGQIHQSSATMDESLWCVTPAYLAERPDVGQLYAIPARSLQSPPTGKWEAIADIDAGKRSDVLLDELDKMLRRADPKYNIDFVIIDCGAEFNPLVSAAFYRADYGFIVTLPNADYFSSIENIKWEHMARYPSAKLDKIHIIVNRAISGDDVNRWGSVAIGFVPDDPQLYADWIVGTPDFSLGYDRVSNAICEILARTLSIEHQNLVPDPIDVWIRPWMNQIVDHHLPEQILASPEFKKTTNRGWLSLVFGIALTLVSLAMLFVLSEGSFAGVRKGGANIAIIQVSSKEEADQIRTRLEEGRSFGALAEAYSTDKYTSSRRGVVDQPIAGDGIVPQIGFVPNLTNCINATEMGNICAETLGAGGSFYLVQVTQKGAGADSSVLTYMVMLFGLLIGLALMIFGYVIVRSQRKRRALLEEVGAHRSDRTYLHQLLTRSASKGPIVWLRSIWEDAVNQNRIAVRKARYGSSEQSNIL